ncbi:MAG: hypothetical protein L0332_18570 [Chloroflexi bacterium]|nr:hypothetical protein [Chloroflexota bacterium]MCI0645543.1 hypothetical protein [Chloroflexota bacterium]MCI0728703.1 hypothetical protein [Chloroflexota bacterium]
MKNYFFFLLLACFLAACNSSDPTPAATPTSPPVEATGPSDIQIAVASDDFAVGTPRVPFVLFSGVERVADAETVNITAYDLASGTPVPGWTGPATSFSDYEVPYWVVYPDIPHAGNWGLSAAITFPDGRTTQAQFAIQVAGEPHTPALGSQPPASQNRTLETEPDIAKLTSSPVPEPGLYQMTVATALESGRPTVVTLATPAYCQTEICAPVVDSVIAVYQELGDQVNFIHLEIYKTFDPLVVADEVDEWGLSSEPWTFVMDKDGQVVARLGGPLSPRELTQAIQPYLQ